jgi:hypothetical protein
MLESFEGDRMPKICCHTLAALLVAALTLAGETTGTWNNVRMLAVGTEVRVEVSGSSVMRGRLGSVTDNSVVLNTGKGQETVGRQQVVRISKKESGHRGRHALVGAGIGAGIGLGVGFAVTNCSHNCIVSPGAIRGVGAAFGAVVGGVLGAVLPGGGWSQVYRP